MDPLTVLHLVTTVATGAYSFTSNAYMVFQAFKAIYDAPKHAQELRQEITLAFQLLESLKDVVTRPDFTTSESLENALEDFKSMLDELNDKMASVKTDRREQLKWPFTIKDTQEKLAKIGRYKETFNLALTTEIA